MFLICFYVATEYGSIWCSAFLYWDEELNAKETAQEEGPKDQDWLEKKRIRLLIA